MSTNENEKTAFLAALAQAIEAQNFIRLSLSKFRGKGEAQKTVATLVLLKGKPHLKSVTSFAHKEETKNFGVEEGIGAVGALVGQAYLSATLFTPDRDLTLSYSRKHKPRLTSAKPTLERAAAPAAHDRSKSYLVPPDRPYLCSLGVTDGRGRVKPTMQGKYRQICRFIEIADALLSESAIPPDTTLSIVDIGSGKGYLTFAIYDYVTTALRRRCQIKGIELRSDLVEFCNRLASDLGFEGLRFELGAAAEAVAQAVDVVIALHACDTATDDAMAVGISSGARLILSAPCCQHELAQQINDTDAGLKGLIKYPLLKQRHADLVTDAARALLLEASGYKVKLIEFVSTEHTAKNILIAATKSGAVDTVAARAQYDALQAATGFSTHHLAVRLGNDK